MLTLAALFLAATTFSLPGGSAVELGIPLKKSLPLPAGCEKIGTNYVAYPCAEYRSEVIKEGYIMSTSQVANLFGALSKEHAFHFQPDDSAQYLVIRVKNTGPLAARGVIKCQLSSDYLPFKVQIPNLKPHMETFAHYAIPLQTFNPSIEPATDDDKFIHLEWEILSIILDLE